MTTPRTTPVSGSQALPGAEARTVLRAKTVATRLAPEELAEVEAAAERDGKSLAEWLRELALKAARQRPADPIELLLTEVAVTRYMLLTLFHSTAEAKRDGIELLPETVLKIRESADNRKYAMARKMLQEFLAQKGAEGEKP